MTLPSLSQYPFTETTVNILKRYNPQCVPLYVLYCPDYRHACYCDTLRTAIFWLDVIDSNYNGDAIIIPKCLLKSSAEPPVVTLNKCNTDVIMNMGLLNILDMVMLSCQEAYDIFHSSDCTEHGWSVCWSFDNNPTYECVVM